jgi:hypothetical protein
MCRASALFRIFYWNKFFRSTSLYVFTIASLAMIVALDYDSEKIIEKKCR